MKQLHQLLEYNFWANDQLITRLLKLAERAANWEQQMSHILQAQAIWNARIREDHNPSDVWALIPPTEWETSNILLYDQSCDLLKTHSLEASIFYQSSNGQHHQNSLEEIFYHLINHGSHHRGQLVYFLRQAHQLTPQLDYIHYLRR